LVHDSGLCALQKKPVGGFKPLAAQNRAGSMDCTVQYSTYDPLGLRQTLADG